MNYKCNKCNGFVSVRIKEMRWITFKCDCEITIVYYDGCIKTKTKKQYEEWKAKQNV